jgi:hypothetical protein
MRRAYTFFLSENFLESVSFENGKGDERITV